MSEKDYQELYSSDSYATRREPEKGFYPPDDRTFHQPGYIYDSVAQIIELQPQPDGFYARVRLDSGETAGLRLAGVSRGTLRLQFWQGEPDFQQTSPMVPALPGDAPIVQTQVGDTAIEMTWEQYRLRIETGPFSFQVFDPQGKSIFSLDTEQIAGKYVSAPLGFRKKENGESRPYLSWRIEGTERYFGFGEKWNKVEKTSTRATIWSADTGGSNTNLLSYKSVPVLYSTAGWGLMLHSSFRSHWDVGTFSYTSGSVLSEEPRLDVFLFFDPGLKGLIERYTALTGRPAVPPKWAMGVWMSRCAYPTAQYIEESRTSSAENKSPVMSFTWTLPG
jgi:alpha-glucosidase (family GH31 glycosyl hydrolase)